MKCRLLRFAVVPTNDLTNLLNDMWVRAGRPANRVLASRTVPRLGHTTVWAVLSGTSKAPARWETVETLVRAMGGDPLQARPLWEKAVAEDHVARSLAGLPRSTHLSGVDTDVPLPSLLEAIEALTEALKENTASHAELLRVNCCRHQ